MNPALERQKAFRAAIEAFLQSRISNQLEEPKTGKTNLKEGVEHLYTYEAWFSRITGQARQIQLVTHPLRATFPDAKIATTTSLYCSPSELPQHDEVGSHSLPQTFDEDIAGNAAVSTIIRDDLRLFMQIEVEGAQIRKWVLESDPDLQNALSDSSGIAKDRLNSLATFLERPEPLRSHSRAKQIYWLVGEDPIVDDEYHLLAPLYSSPLAHTVFQTINEDRFGEAGKLARQARREHRDHETGYHEYPNLAVQKFGGTKPQNISQLNNVRGGKNYLLASNPPKWKTQPVKVPLFVDSVFPFFGRVAEVRQTVQILHNLLLSDARPNVDTHNQFDALLDQLIDELVTFAHPLQAILPAGWTRNPDCRLADDEKLWLDPRRAESDDAADAEFSSHWQWMDWPINIGRRFGNWLNHALGQTLPLGDSASRHWQDELLLHTEWAGMLHRQRVALKTSLHGAAR